MDIEIFCRTSEINFRLPVRQVQEGTERNGGTHTEICSLEY